jgi:multidrug efflux pump subunit AcrB
VKPGIFDRLARPYGSLLSASLKRPFVVIGGIAAAFVIGMWLFSFVPFLFFPDNDRPIVTANIELPLGTSIERTEEVLDDIEAFIRDNLLVTDAQPEGVLSWSSYIGQGAPKYDLGYMPPESNPSSAHVLINTTSDEGNQVVIDKLDRYCFDTYPEMTARIARLEMGGGSAYPIAVRLTGKDTDKLFDLVDEVKSQLAAIEGTRSISDSWGMRTKKLVVDINQAKARQAGITNRDVAVSLRTLLAGTQTGEFREDDKTIPIVLRNDRAGQLDIGKLESLNIHSQYSGKSVPLKQIADIEVKWEYSKIVRRDQYRTVTVFADIRGGYNAAEITKEIAAWLAEEKAGWGAGYTYNLGGEAEESAEGMNSVARNLPLSMFIILLLLIGQFNSFRKTVIVLATIPLGLIGVALGLLVTRSYFGFMGFLGIISLSGIVINNAIVLLDRIKIEIEELGKTPQEAVIAAAQQRFRPIMLTTFTTSLGLLPLWLSGGIMWEPMAIGIFFGLLFATVITLIFVPVLYRVFFRVKYA